MDTCPDNKDSVTDFTFSALLIFIPSLPVTHLLGLLAHRPKAARVKHLLQYPFKGGKNHLIFQIISWTIWTASILVAGPLLLPHEDIENPGSHTDILSGAAAVGSVFAELFMIKSLLVFEPAPFSSKDDTGSPRYSRRAIPSKPLAATAVVAMGALWVSLAGALVWATEFLEDSLSKQVYVGMSGACLLIGVTTTYGIGGKLWNARQVGREAKTAWRFFQPFKGGAAFVATQALGWALFSISLIVLLWLISQIAAGVAYCIRCYLLGTCCIMGGAYLLLGLSIWTYKGPQTALEVVEATNQKVVDTIKPRRIVPRRAVWLPILAFYTPVHLFSSLVLLTFCIAPARFTVPFWLGTLLLYYVLTSQGSPHHTGCREWPQVREWLKRDLRISLQAWFGRVEVINTNTEPLDPSNKYLFGYQPHGLFPIGAPYLPLLDDFQSQFPGINPTPLVASVCFHVPVVRDLCSWCGVRQVARRTFVQALSDTGSVILVPGGQAELVRSWRFFARDEFAIYQRHRGFVRIAIEQGAALVPVLCLGEISALKNLFDWPALQNWTYKKFGFPIPFLLVGRWGCTPFPRQTGLRFIIGKPIQPPSSAIGTQVDESILTELHTRYYQAVQDMYHAYQPSFPGYENKKLVMV